MTEKNPVNRTLVSVSPFRCRMWSLHDRLEEYISEESCKSEIESLAKHGQLLPVLGRPIRGDTAYDAELIYGARRLFIAKHLNVPLTVELREMSDKEAIVALDIENRHRKDISPYERALSYVRWLREGQFTSQDDLARTLRISASQVSRLLQFAKLPAVVIAAFPRPVEIRETWGLDLVKACEDPLTRQSIVRRARMVAASKVQLSSLEVYQSLMGVVAGSPRRGRRLHDEVVKANDGMPLFRIRHQRKTVALLLPAGKASSKSLERIRQAVAQILQTTPDASLPSVAGRAERAAFRGISVPTS